MGAVFWFYNFRGQSLQDRVKGYGPTMLDYLLFTEVTYRLLMNLRQDIHNQGTPYCLGQQQIKPVSHDDTNTLFVPPSQSQCFRP